MRTCNQCKAVIEAQEANTVHMIEGDPGQYTRFESVNLPILAECCPVITMTRQQVIRFRNNYTQMMEFAASVCGVPVEKLCGMDILAYILRKRREESKVAGE